MTRSELMNGDINAIGTVAEHDAADFQVMSSLRSDVLLLQCFKNTQLFIEGGNCSCPFYMLRYHRDRMLAAVEELGWTGAWNFLQGQQGVTRLKEVLQDHLEDRSTSTHPSQPLKLRVTINLQGLVSAKSTPLPFLPLSTLSFSLFPPVLSQLPPSIDHATAERSWRIFISPNPVTPSLYTRHKTTERSIYDEARSSIPNLPRRKEHPNSIMKEILIVNHNGEVMEGSITTPYFWRLGQWVTPLSSAGGNMGTTRRYALEAGLCVEETVTEESITDGEAIWLSNGARGWGWGEIEKLGENGGSDTSIGPFPNGLV
ncbi:MAG: hypothetical protein L6R40_002813 [Gallowayella cf. fulva]|nr:MAG: hypothetical protein L6R40_002813 [Xanthomendoza cf. fulva]